MHCYIQLQAYNVPSVQAGCDEAVYIYIYLKGLTIKWATGLKGIYVLAHFSSLNESFRLGKIVEAFKALESVVLKKDIKEDITSTCKLSTPYMYHPNFCPPQVHQLPVHTTVMKPHALAYQVLIQ